MLKKPSEYFKKDIGSVNKSVQELVKTPELNTFSDAFESFKNNLSKIEVLSDFSDALDNYQINIEKVNYLSEKVEHIQIEVQDLLRKEDLDRAMMSQLLVVEQSIVDIQSKVKAINEKNLTEIRLDVSELTESVSEFLEVEVPKYKKLVVDSEIRTNNRYDELKENLNKTLEGIGEFVDNKYQELTDNLQSINEQSISYIIEDFKNLDKIVLDLKEQEIPKYKDFIVETERKTELKLNEFKDKLDETLENFDEKVSNKVNDIQSSVVEIDEKFEKLREQEIPKYKGFIVETERKTEFKLDEFNNKLNQTVDSLLKKITSVEGDKSNLIKVVNDKIQEVLSLKDLVLTDLEQSEFSRNDLNKKIRDLEVEVIRNESHLKVQNKNLEQIQEDVRSAIQKLNLKEIEEKNYELSKKIRYLEEIFEKFNEKEILTENIVAEPPSTNNKDPLTPLDQKFVTLQQLQDHYRLFINRIQQQLSTIGGSGETRLKYLDDIVGIATNPSVYDGKYLKYNHGVGKFEFGSGWTDTVDDSDDLTYTYSRVAVGTDSIANSPYPGNNLLVYGDARITGVVAIGTASILLNPETGSIQSGDVQVVSSDGSANYTGVVTAFGFVGLGTTSFFSDLVASNLTLDSALSVGGSLNVSGDLIVDGTTTTINSVTLTVDDKSIELASSDSPSDISADGGGIVLKGDTDHSIIWSNENDSWDFSENVNLISGREYRINDLSVLTSTTLGVGVTNSSLTSFGIVPVATINNIENENLNTSGIGTIQNLNANTANIQVLTASNFSSSEVAIGTDSIANSPYPGNNLLVYGDARITGTVAIGTASIILDPVSGSIRSGETEIISSGGSANFTGIVTAHGFVGLGTTSFFSDLVASNLTLDSALSVETLDTTVGIIDNLSSTNINVTGVGTFSSIHGDGSNITGILLTQLADIDASNLGESSNDYLLVYDPSIPGFKFVNPKTYFGINNDANSDPLVEDYGSF